MPAPHSCSTSSLLHQQTLPLKDPLLKDTCGTLGTSHASHAPKHAADLLSIGCGLTCFVRGTQRPFVWLAPPPPLPPPLRLSTPYLELPCIEVLPTPHARTFLCLSTLLTNAINMQVPPYLETMNLDAMWQGQEPIFRLKLTHLGDGSSILASSLPHGIADGSRHAMLLADLATAYRGEQVRAFWLYLRQQGGLGKPSC